MVPLVSSFMLSAKEGKKIWVEPVIDAAAANGWRFEVKTGSLSKANEERLKNGTKTGRGSNFSCVLTGSTLDGNYVRSRGHSWKNERPPHGDCRARAPVGAYTCPRQRNMRPLATNAKPASEAGRCTRRMIPRNFCTHQVRSVRLFASLFTSRQLVALTTFSDLDQRSATRGTDAMHMPLGYRMIVRPLHAGGSGATAYADAMATYLSLYQPGRRRHLLKHRNLDGGPEKRRTAPALRPPSSSHDLGL